MNSFVLFFFFFSPNILFYILRFSRFSVYFFETIFEIATAVNVIISLVRVVDNVQPGLKYFAFIYFPFLQYSANSRKNMGKPFTYQVRWKGILCNNTIYHQHNIRMAKLNQLLGNMRKKAKKTNERTNGNQKIVKIGTQARAQVMYGHWSYESEPINKLN